MSCIDILKQGGGVKQKVGGLWEYCARCKYVDVLGHGRNSSRVQPRVQGWCASKGGGVRVVVAFKYLTGKVKEDAAKVGIRQKKMYFVLGTALFLSVIQ